MHAVTKLAVMVSGKSTILEAMLKAGLEVSLVVADRACRGLKLAEAAAVPYELVERTSYGKDFDRMAYSSRIAATLQAHSIDMVAMAGFMTILEAPVFDLYHGKILNTHPSLLPEFRGEHAVRDTLAAGAKISGCTIHIATLELDAGPILAQESVAILPGDTPESLQERIKTVERRLYPETLKRLLKIN